jgi:glycosyltransferase involved in cell wall biosynthesis
MISLIVATVGRVTELERLLGSLEVQSCRDFEVIVVDQNADHRLAPVLARHAGLAIRRLHSKPGLSRARNVGLRAARGEILAIPDDDCWYPPPALLASMAEWFAIHSEFGMLGVAVRNAEDQPAGPNAPSRAQRCTRINVWRCCVSTALFLRRSVATTVGDFNEDIGAGACSAYQSGEETDYVLRALERGFSMWFEPSLTVHHPSLHSMERLRKTTYPFALGTGRVLRMHGYPLHQVGGHLLRSLAGAVISLGRGDPARAQVYLWRGAGQLVGYVFSSRRSQRPLLPLPPSYPASR